MRPQGPRFGVACWVVVSLAVAACTSATGGIWPGGPGGAGEGTDSGGVMPFGGDTGAGSSSGSGSGSGGGEGDGAVIGHPVTLASGGFPQAIAVDSTSVYWTDAQSGVLKVPVGGGATTTLAPAQGGGPYGIAVNASGVFWVNNQGGTVCKVPLSGGTVTTLATDQGQPFSVAVDAAHVYWESNVNTTGAVVQLPLDGGTVETLATAELQILQYLAVDDTNVYWANQDVYQMAKTGGGQTITLARLQSVQGFAVGASAVYWGNSALDTLDGTPIGGGALSTLVSADVVGLTVDATSVYYSTGDAVVKIPLAGGTPTTLASGLHDVQSLTVDDTSVYWINGPPYGVTSCPTCAVLKIAK